MIKMRIKNLNSKLRLYNPKNKLQVLNSILIQ